ncbi:MAG: hypothetical protein ACI920_002573 [Saprospiraceae bacterium]|jgi:hypothetical protein
MKKLKLLSTFLLLFVYTFSYAQVEESERSMIAGVFPALSIVLPNTDDKDAEKWWKTYLKEMDAKTKKIKKSDVYLTESFRDVHINGIKLINLYARTEEVGDDAEHIVWFDLGDGNFLSEDTVSQKSYEAAQKFMLRYGLHISKKKTELELKGEKKTMKGFENGLSRLAKQNETYHKKTANAKQLIIDMNAALVQNADDQESTKQAIETEEDAKALKSLKNNLKKLVKQNGNYLKKIDGAESLIPKMASNVEQNILDQEAKKKEIKLQREVINEVKKRLADLQ